MRWKRTLEKRRAFTGWMFVLPWIVGVIPFFIIPLISTLYYSLGELKLAAGGIDVTFLGGENYLALFTKDPTFVKELVGSLKTMLTESFMILVFGLFSRCCSTRNSMGARWRGQFCSCRLSSPPAW